MFKLIDDDLFRHNADRVRLAWKQLAGDNHDAASELGAVCDELIKRHGVDIAGEVFGLILLQATLAEHDRGIRPVIKRQRELQADARRAARDLRRALGAVIRIHQESVREKWYRDAVIGDRRAWAEPFAAYRLALENLERDPVLKCHDTRTIQAVRRGNPRKSHHSNLRRNLQNLGLTRREVDDVVYAIQRLQLDTIMDRAVNRGR